MKPAFPGKVCLRDRYNNVWTVKVTKVGDDWYFVDGWDKFVDDNLLTSGDLMVFEYFCDRLFNVKVYGLSATEKNIVGPSTLNGVENEEPISQYDDDIDYVDDHDDDDETETENCDYIFKRRDDHDSEDEETEDEHKEVVQEQVDNGTYIYMFLHFSIFARFS